MYLQAIEEAFDHNHLWSIRGSCAMEVEKELRFWEPRWKPVARFACVESATAITDQFAELTLNRNNEPVMHQPRPVVKPNSKLSRGGLVDATHAEIWVMQVDAAQPKWQRGRELSFFRNRCLYRR